jgi:phenylacetate-CoA ligase
LKDLTSRLAARLKPARFGDRWIRRNPLVYPKFSSTFRRLAAADLGQRQEFVQAQLGRILSLAMTSRYGKSISDRARIDAWPLLDKGTVRADPAAFMPACIWPVAKASTGGTTGEPLELARSLSSIAVEQAAVDFAISRLGVDGERARMAVLRADSIKDPADRSPPFWILTNGGQRLVCSSAHLAADTLPEYVKALQEFDPDVLWVYPTSLQSLCRLLDASPYHPTIRSVLSSSEMLAPDVWRAAQAGLGCRLVDYYGQAERVAFAYASEPGEYRFLPGYSYVELERAFADATHDYYEIIGTTLWNQAMPLVRYRTGDLAQLPHDLTAVQVQQVAFGLQAFDGITGRIGEELLAPDGTHIIGLNHFPRDVRHLLRLQIVQESLDRVLVRVLAMPEFDEVDRHRLLENVRAKVPPSITVTIEQATHLETTRSGKTPYVIHRPTVRAALADSPASRTSKQWDGELD